MKSAVNWLVNKLSTHLNMENASIKECKITPENFAEFIILIYQNKMNNTIAQKVLDIMYRTSKDPSQILEDEDLRGSTQTDQLDSIISQVLKKNPDAVENYKKGKKTVIMYLVGQVMKDTKGKADATQVKELIEKKIA